MPLMGVSLACHCSQRCHFPGAEAPPPSFSAVFKLNKTDKRPSVRVLALNTRVFGKTKEKSSRKKHPMSLPEAL